MATDTETFLRDPTAFLSTTVLIIPEAGDNTIGRSRVHRFTLAPKQRNAVWLALDDGAGGPGGITAYYLPWQRSRCVAMMLSSEAKFFFTSQLTNCRFGVIEKTKGSKGSVRVAHTAGNDNKFADRDELDRVKSFVARTGEQKRIFDTEGGMKRPAMTRGFGANKEILRPAADKKHDYRGQTGDKSSATIVGINVADSWKFYAQVTSGHRNEASGSPLSSDLAILPWKGETQTLVEI